MVRYITYLRKSTDDKKRQILSLQAQRRVTADLAKRLDCRVVRKLEESQSAKQPGRPHFNRMLEMIERGEADGILCWAINRLYRNPVDEGRVRWLLQRGLIKSIVTAQREYTPAEAGLLMAIEGGRAADELATLKANVARGIEEKLLGGAWPGCRTFGYAYDHEKKNLVPHPKHGKIVTRIYEEYAAGGRGLVWVADRLAQLGIVTKRGDPWPKSKVHDFLTNKIYVGIMAWNGRDYEGRYEPLVSPELFRKVAENLRIRAKPHKVRHAQAFPLRAMFLCPCGSMLTAQIARGNGGTYRYYRCSRSKGACPERYVQERSLVSQGLGRLTEIGLTPALASEVRERLAALHAGEQAALEEEAETIERQLSMVQDELNALTRACARLTIDDDSYTAASSDLLMQKASLKRKKQRIESTSTAPWFEPALDAVETLQLAAKQQTETSIADISSILRKAATNHRISSREVRFDWVEPYQTVANRLGKMGDAGFSGAAFADNPLSSRPYLLGLADYLRTFFRENEARGGVGLAGLEPIKDGVRRGARIRI